MTKKRVFVISREKFPRGSAGANYIQYLSLALLDQKFEVIVIGEGDLREQDKKEDVNKFIYKGIEYYNDSTKETFYTRLGHNKEFLKELVSKYNMSEEDYYIFYTLRYELVKFFIKRYDTSKMVFIRVEDLQPYQFKLGKFNPNYILHIKARHYCYKKVGKSLAISTVIEKQDRKGGSKTLCLPIMADPFEYGDDMVSKKPDTINLIYSGVKETSYEDDVYTMLESLSALSDEELKRVRINITGCSEEAFFDRFQDRLTNIKDNIVIHGWLDYEDLVVLYKKMDFLLLARKVNEITKANFPSKVPELMSFGVVPICTRVGDYTKYYLNESNSFICDVNDKEDIRKAIQKAIELPEDDYLAMREEAKNLVKERLYYKVWASKISRFLLEE